MWQGTPAPLLKKPTGQERVVMVVGLRKVSAGMGGAAGQPISCLVGLERWSAIFGRSSTCRHVDSHHIAR